MWMNSLIFECIYTLHKTTHHGRKLVKELLAQHSVTNSLHPKYKDEFLDYEEKENIWKGLQEIEPSYILLAIKFYLKRHHSPSILFCLCIESVTAYKLQKVEKYFMSLWDFKEILWIY